MKPSNPLDDHDELLPLERVRAESLLRVLIPMRLDQLRMKKLRELTGLTPFQFDKTLNLLIKTGLAKVKPGDGCVNVECSAVGQKLRETRNEEAIRWKSDQ